MNRIELLPLSAQQLPLLSVELCKLAECMPPCFRAIAVPPGPKASSLFLEGSHSPFLLNDRAVEDSQLSKVAEPMPATTDWPVTLLFSNWARLDVGIRHPWLRERFKLDQVKADCSGCPINGDRLHQARSNRFTALTQSWAQSRRPQLRSRQARMLISRHPWLFSRSFRHATTENMRVFIESGMDIDKIKGRLTFLQEAEKLKSVLRSAHTSTGRTESTAEHTWRLCLMAMTFEDELAGMDMLKLLKMCLVHDLGEAIHGDIPAIEKDQHPDKSEQEKADLLHLTRSLDKSHQTEILSLWQEYEDAASPEAKAVKALDKLETILQHNQGVNPADFDYGFNLTYGQKHTSAEPLFSLVRGILDEGTRQRMAEASRNPEQSL